jgi:hypothetical protein
MSKGLPTRAKAGVPGKTVTYSPATYFIAKRMENAGMLRPGQALLLAAALPDKIKPPKKGKRR